MNKLVSIITPVHNAEKFLEQCMASVRSQSYPNWEHILVNDCSTDNSLAIIQKHAVADKRIRYVTLEKNSGAGIARNKAIEIAKGDYIAFLDSDDLWFPEKLKRQLEFMQANNFAFTFTSYYRIDEDGKRLSGKVRAKPVMTYKKALYKNPIGCLTVIYSVDFFGKQYMPAIRKRQDYALWLKLLKQTNAYGLDECLSSYRMGNKSISSNKFDLVKYEWQIYREVEGLSFLKSTFYLLSAIILKMKSYF